MRTNVLVCSLVFLAVAAGAFSQDSDQSAPGRIMLSAGFGTGSMVGGNQYHDFHNAISPTPDSVRLTTLQVDLRVFPITHFGFEASSDVIGIVAGTYQTNNDLYDAIISVYSGGALFRLPLPLGDSNSADLFLGGGANYNSFRYASDYIDLVHNGGYSLYDVKSQVGYYFKVGGSFYLGRPFFAVAELEYQKLSNSIVQTGVQFDAEYVKFNLRAGMDF